MKLVRRGKERHIAPSVTGQTPDTPRLHHPSFRAQSPPSRHGGMSATRSTAGYLHLPCDQAHHHAQLDFRRKEAPASSRNVCPDRAKHWPPGQGQAARMVIA